MMVKQLLGLAGTVIVEITGACPEDCFSRMAVSGIWFQEFQKTDELTIRLRISVRDISAVRRCAKKTMCNLEICEISGLLPHLRAMGLRLLYPPVLCSLLLLIFWFQGHIWFFSISGNETIPTEKILWVLEENGIHFWTNTADLDMNTVKNHVLKSLPELSWITINTEGGLAEVIVRERSEPPELHQDFAPANVLAKKSGVISAVEITGGTPQVKTGDIVLAGDLLISGVSDLDRTVFMTRAEGEIYATTWNHFHVILPKQVTKKVYTGQETAQYSLTIGKKTINFYKTSGISYSNYDKITERTDITLPGGYTFPLCITKNICREYKPADVSIDAEEAQRFMAQTAAKQLLLGMTAGSILEMRQEMGQADGQYTLIGTAACREEIGITDEIKD